MSFSAHVSKAHQMSGWLAVQAWTELLLMDLTGIFGFRAIHRAVRRTRTARTPADDTTVPAVVGALTTASLLYFKRAYCLQRSAVATRLLRRRGIAAELVVGCRRPPLTAHAWVEVDGHVVSEARDDLEFFSVLDRW